MHILRHIEMRLNTGMTQHRHSNSARLITASAIAFTV